MRRRTRVLLQREREPVGARFRARECDRAVDVVVLEQLDEQIGLAALRHGVRDVRDARGRRRDACGTISTRTGSCSRSRVSSRNSGAIVAEKNSVWRLAGTS